MAARGLLSKTVFQPNLVSCLQYRLFLPSKTSNIQAISDEKKNILLKLTAVLEREQKL